MNRGYTHFVCETAPKSQPGGLQADPSGNPFARMTVLLVVSESKLAEGGVGVTRYFPIRNEDDSLFGLEATVAGDSSAALLPVNATNCPWARIIGCKLH